MNTQDATIASYDTTIAENTVIIQSQDEVIALQTDTISLLNTYVTETQAISGNTDYYKTFYDNPTWTEPISGTFGVTIQTSAFSQSSDSNADDCDCSSLIAGINTAIGDESWSSLQINEVTDLAGDGLSALINCLACPWISSDGLTNLYISGWTDMESLLDQDALDRLQAKSESVTGLYVYDMSVSTTLLAQIDGFS